MPPKGVSHIIDLEKKLIEVAFYRPFKMQSNFDIYQYSSDTESYSITMNWVLKDGDNTYLFGDTSLDQNRKLRFMNPVMSSAQRAMLMVGTIILGMGL